MVLFTLSPKSLPMIWILSFLLEIHPGKVEQRLMGRHDRDPQRPRNFTDFTLSNTIMAQQFVQHFNLNRTMILPCIGNWDTYPHNIVEGGPNIVLETLYNLWEPFFPPKASIDGAILYHDFLKGGYYYREIVSNQLAVLSLNTNYWSLENTAVSDCSENSSEGSRHFVWLNQKLELLKRRGMKVYLLGHVPPVDSTSNPLYKPSCYTHFVNTMGKYHDLLVGSVVIDFWHLFWIVWTY
jgi:endopolyphosphatase